MSSTEWSGHTNMLNLCNSGHSSVYGWASVRDRAGHVSVQEIVTLSHSKKNKEIIIQHLHINIYLQIHTHFCSSAFFSTIIAHSSITGWSPLYSKQSRLARLQQNTCAKKIMNSCLWNEGQNWSITYSDHKHTPTAYNENDLKLNLMLVITSYGLSQWQKEFVS